MSFSTLSPDSRTLVSKWNTKLALIWKVDFGPLGNSPILLLLSPGKTPLMTTVAKFLDTSVCGGSWCLDPSLSPFLVKVTQNLESILLDNPHKAAVLNIDKTKELVVDYRRQSREHTPITIDKTPVERVTSFKFFGVHITEDLTWSAHTDAVLKKAHQRLFFLRRLRKFGTSPRILRSFYTCTVESILTGCITAWFGNSTAGNRRALQRVVRTARHIVGGELPSLQDIYTRRCTRKARRIIKDSSHPSHRLLSLLPSGRRFRSIRSCTSRLRDSFFPQAIRLMNSQKWPTLQHTPTHTTCHALHFNTVQLDYMHTLH